MSYEDRTSALQGEQVQAACTSSAPSEQTGKSRRKGKRRSREDRPQRSEDGPQGGAAAEAPTPSITGASSSQKRVTGGLDWLDVGCYGDWDKAKFEALMVKLAAAQKAAAVDENDYSGSAVELDEGDRLMVAPHGVSKGLYFRYRVEALGGTKLYIRDRQAYDEKNASVFVQIGSEELMMYGHRRAWERAKELLHSLGFKMVRNLIARTDICTDHPNEPAHQVITDIVDGAHIKRAKDGAVYFSGLKLTGYAVGKKIHMRIYDKLDEVQNNESKLAIMIAHRWGGELPESATRCEFQLPGEELRKRFVTHSVEDLFERLPLIIQALTMGYNGKSSWFRMTDRPITDADREQKNHSRYGVGEFWVKVIQGFFSWAGEAQDVVRIEHKPRPDAKQIKRQAFGCLQKVAVLMGEAIETAHDAQRFVMRLLRAEFDEFIEGVAEKRLRMSHKHPSELFIPDGLIPF